MFVERSVNWTVSGAVPVSGVPEKSATGGVTGDETPWLNGGLGAAGTGANISLYRLCEQFLERGALGVCEVIRSYRIGLCDGFSLRWWREFLSVVGRSKVQIIAALNDRATLWRCPLGRFFSVPKRDLLDHSVLNNCVAFDHDV